MRRGSDGWTDNLAWEYSPQSPLPLHRPLCLQEKVGLLERYDFEHVQQSVCMRHYTRCRVAETY